MRLMAAGHTKPGPGKSGNRLLLLYFTIRTKTSFFLGLFVYGGVGNPRSRWFFAAIRRFSICTCYIFDRVLLRFPELSGFLPGFEDCITRVDGLLILFNVRLDEKRKYVQDDVPSMFIYHKFLICCDKIKLTFDDFKY